jgi:hypothetical protein
VRAAFAEPVGAKAAHGFARQDGISAAPIGELERSAGTERHINEEKANTIIHQFVAIRSKLNTLGVLLFLIVIFTGSGAFALLKLAFPKFFGF